MIEDEFKDIHLDDPDYQKAVKDYENKKKNPFASDFEHLPRQKYLNKEAPKELRHSKGITIWDVTDLNLNRFDYTYNLILIGQKDCGHNEEAVKILEGIFEKNADWLAQSGVHLVYIEGYQKFMNLYKDFNVQVFPTF